MPDMIRELTSSGLFFLPTAIVSVISLAFHIILYYLLNRVDGYVKLLAVFGYSTAGLWG